jgi:CRP/FNR family transcriptional regulator, cyclic AMP receptor protein
MTTHTTRISKGIADALKQSYVFAKAGAEDIAGLVPACEWDELPAKSVLVNEGEKCRSLFVLAKGRLVVKEAVTPTSELIIARISPGDVVGEVSFFDGRPASASVRTDDDSQVVRIDHAALRKVFQERPGLELVFHREVVRTLAERLRRGNQTIRASLSSSMVPHV